ncbi:MAG: hypothetical protein ACYYKD_08070 [Rhodospirillales bacterium]
MIFLLHSFGGDDEDNVAIASTRTLGSDGMRSGRNSVPWRDDHPEVEVRRGSRSCAEELIERLKKTEPETARTGNNAKLKK